MDKTHWGHIGDILGTYWGHIGDTLGTHSKTFINTNIGHKIGYKLNGHYFKHIYRNYLT